LVTDEIVELSAADLNTLESVLQQMGGFTSIKKQNNVLQLFIPMEMQTQQPLINIAFKIILH